LRAFTPRDQRAVKAAAETFRPNPKLDTARVITELGKGEALTSFLQDDGTPSVVERTLIAPPSAHVGPISPDERKALLARSPVKGKYDQALEAESAYEVLQSRAQGAAEPQEDQQAVRSGGFLGGLGDTLDNLLGTGSSRGKRLTTGQHIAREVTRSVTNRVAGQIAADFGRAIGGRTGGTIGRAIVRGTLGGLLRRR
jgi:hypothetical protein